jgi:hypothetical protein
MVLYNKDTDTYDMIERQIAEDLTEKFGYMYNTDVMDALQVGETVSNKIIYKTTSYDENMNYRLGKNANVAYASDNSTIEDAVKIRQGWAETVKTVEIDTVMVSINDNDILLNLYGNDKVEYKPFPDIGEKIENSSLCAVRRIKLNHVFYDFQEANLREVYDTDTEYRVPKDSEIYDINVYCNAVDGLPDNVFYNQVKYYHEKIKEYAVKISNWCDFIKKSTSNRTMAISALKSKYQHYVDPEWIWKYRDRAFSNVNIEFKTKTIVNLQEGFKLVGRYGDKGIISSIAECGNNGNPVTNITNNLLDMLNQDVTEEERNKLSQNVAIVKDSDMPYLEDGTPIDILLNASGAIRRLNSGQLYEVEINFIAENIRKKLITLETLKEKEDMIFDFLQLLNQDEYEYVLGVYNSFDKVVKLKSTEIRFINETAKRKFISDIERDGFYIIKPPHSNMRYECIKRLYERFDWIKPYNVYIDLFGIPHKKVMRPMVVGSKYMYLLKQTSNKNFSARSTGRIDKKGIPAKSSDKKNNLIVSSNTPIKIGETHNMLSAVSGRIIAEFNLLMRNSPMARKAFTKIIGACGNPLNIKNIPIYETYTNVNADILNAYFKTIGIRLTYLTSDQTAEVLINQTKVMNIGGYNIMDTPLNKFKYTALFKEYYNYIENQFIVESYPGEKYKMAWDNVFKKDSIKKLKLPKDLKGLLIAQGMEKSNTTNTNGVA